MRGERRPAFRYRRDVVDGVGGYEPAMCLALTERRFKAEMVRAEALALSGRL